MKPLNKIRIDGHMVIHYSCGCKSCLSGKLKKLVFGVGYNQETQTNRILKDILIGDYGKEWKALLNENPSGTVDINVELFVCPKCSYWANDYNLSFYTLSPQYSTERKSIIQLEEYSDPKLKQMVIELIDKYQNHYQFYKEYQHVCPTCSSVMLRVPLRKDSWINEEKLQLLQLKCPKCKQPIEICNLKP